MGIKSKIHFEDGDVEIKDIKPSEILGFIHSYRSTRSKRPRKYFTFWSLDLILTNLEDGNDIQHVTHVEIEKGVL